MNCYARPIVPALLLMLSLPLGSSVVHAQEETETETAARPGRIVFEVETWISQPAGLGYQPATEHDFDNFFDNTILSDDPGTETEFYYRAGYQFPGKWGKLVFSTFAHGTDSKVERFEPGRFVFGETLTYNLFAGFANDGLADAFSWDSTTKLRDLRLDYIRPAFESDRARGSWILGWRRVKHDRSQGASYFALVPGLPPIIPPNVSQELNLDPLPDEAVMSSRFEGRGPTLGFQMEFPLLKNRLTVEGEATITVMRGDLDSEYAAVNHVYTVDGVVIGPPYDEFGQVVEDPPDSGIFTPDIEQQSLGITLRSTSESATSQALQASIGFRWKVMRWLEVTGGFRTVRFDDVGVDLRPKQVGIVADTVNAEDIDTVSRSATYEGFYAGLVFRMF